MHQWHSHTQPKVLNKYEYPGRTMLQDWSSERFNIAFDRFSSRCYLFFSFPFSQRENVSAARRRHCPPPSPPPLLSYDWWRRHITLFRPHIFFRTLEPLSAERIESKKNVTKIRSAKNAVSCLIRTYRHRWVCELLKLVGCCSRITNNTILSEAINTIFRRTTVWRRST